jgi:hypothetical protein
VFDANGKAKFYNITNRNEVIGRMIPLVNNLTLSNTTLSGIYQAQNLITVLSTLPNKPSHQYTTADANKGL